MTRRDDECRAVLARVSAYLDGELDASACAGFERHAQDCSSCAALVDDLRRVGDLCRDVGARPLPAPVRQRARERIRRLLAGDRSDPPDDPAPRR